MEHPTCDHCGTPSALRLVTSIGSLCRGCLPLYRRALQKAKPQLTKGERLAAAASRHD